jgi:flagellar hook-associated protein 2
MASISGLGSGLDVESIISSLMSVEKIPQQKYAALKTAADARVTAWTTLSSKLTALGTAAGTLKTSASGLAAIAASTNTGVASATAAAGTPPTSLDINVTSLARAQQQASAGLASASVLAGAGTAVVAGGMKTVGASGIAVDSSATAGRHVITVRGPGAASVTASTPPGEVTSTDLTVTLGNGTTRTVQVPADTTSATDLVTALRASLGDLVSVGTSGGALVLSGRDTGPGSSLTIGGSAAAALGLSTTTAYGDVGGVTVDGTAATLSTNGGTTSATANGVTLSFAGALTAGTVSAVVVRTDAASTVGDVASQLAVAGSPVSAAVVDTRDGTAASFRMLLSSRTAGSDGEVVVSGDALAGLSSLSTTVASADATLQVGGVTIKRSSNTISDLLPGVTVTLAAEGSTTISVNRDQSQAATQAKGLVDALNSMLSQLDTSTAKGAALASDSSARSLTSSLRSLGSSISGTGNVAVLSQLGISVQRDGTYSLDNTKLSAALSSDPDAALGLLNQFATRLNTLATDATKSTGSASLAKAAASADSALRQKQVDSYDDRLAALETRYRAQYTALDSAMQAATSLKAQLAAQLSGMSLS